MNDLSISVMKLAERPAVKNGLMVGGYCFQGAAIYNTVDEIENAYRNDQLSTMERKIEVAKQTVFLSTQVAKVVVRNNVQVLPIVNCISGVVDVVKTGIHGHIHHENPLTTTLKIAEKIFDHSTETISSLIKQPTAVPGLAKISIGLNIVKAIKDAGCFAYRYVKRKRN